jgi:hypothetical protein
LRLDAAGAAQRHGGEQPEQRQDDGEAAEHAQANGEAVQAETG